MVQYHAPLYRKLAEHDALDVHVFYLDRTGVEPVYDATMGVHIVWDIPLLEGYPHTFVPNWSPLRHGPSSLRRINPRLVRHLVRGRWDAILIQGYLAPSDWLAFASGRLSGTPIFFRGEATLRAGSGGWREWLKTRLLRRAFAWSRAVLFSCRGNREFFLHYGCPEDKLFPIPCAVDNTFFRNQCDALADELAGIRSELEIPAELPIVLNTCRHIPNKGHRDLLRAVRQLADEGIELALVLVGGGPETEALQQLVQELELENVRFTGFVRQLEIVRYYAVADVFVLASEYDPSPKVLNEALNFELPIVCSERPGTAGDVVVDGENGYLYDYGDVDRLAAAIRRLLQDRALRERMGRRSLEIADAWSLEADVEAVRKVFESLNRPESRTNAQFPE